MTSASGELHSFVREIDRWRDHLIESLEPTLGLAVRLIGSRSERNEHFARLAEFTNRAHQIAVMSPMVNRKRRKEAYLTFQEDWRIYSEEFRLFVRERTYRMLPMTSPIFRELMEEPTSEQMPATMSTSALVASTSTPYPSAFAPIENDRKSVMTSESESTHDWQSFRTFDTAELGTPRARPQEMLDVNIQEFDDLGPEGIHGAVQMSTKSAEVEQILTSALFQLVNVDNPTLPAIVAVQEHMEAATDIAGFGDIYKGLYIVADRGRSPFEYFENVPVVAKKNKVSGEGKSVEEQRQERLLLRKRTMKEARIAEYLDHPSVTHYFGLFVEKADLGNDLADLYLVSDYVNSGLAKHYLKEHHTSQVAEKLFCDLMDGLTYMHSEQRLGSFDKKMICHGDLKGNNYLVEVQPNETNPSQPRITGRITDFGLSTILNPNPLLEIDSGSSQVSHAVRWRAPEMADVEDGDIEMRDRFMEKADVWSFALTCLEVAQNLKHPFPSLGNMQFNKAWFSNRKVLSSHLPRTNPTAESDAKLSEAAFEVMTVCWELEPNERPHMRDAQARYYRELR